MNESVWIRWNQTTIINWRKFDDWKRRTGQVSAGTRRITGRWQTKRFKVKPVRSVHLRPGWVVAESGKNILAQMVVEKPCELVRAVSRVLPRGEVRLREGAVMALDYMGMDNLGSPFWIVTVKVTVKIWLKIRAKVVLNETPVALLRYSHFCSKTLLSLLFAAYLQYCRHFWAL